MCCIPTNDEEALILLLIPAMFPEWLLTHVCLLQPPRPLVPPNQYQLNHSKHLLLSTCRHQNNQLLHSRTISRRILPLLQQLLLLIQTILHTTRKAERKARNLTYHHLTNHQHFGYPVEPSAPGFQPAAYPATAAAYPPPTAAGFPPPTAPGAYPPSGGEGTNWSAAAYPPYPPQQWMTML